MGFFSKTEEKGVEWNHISDEDQIQEIVNDQSGESHLIFKHSTRCGISSMAKSQFERQWNSDSKTKLWYLDLLSFRPISDNIAELTRVQHQSPQVIVIRNGEVIYSESHHSIDANQILKLN